MSRFAPLFALSVAALVGQPCAGLALSWSAAKDVEAKNLVTRFIDPQKGRFAGHSPAISLAIGIDGEIAMIDGFGEASPGRSASPNTAYRIGSLTKQFAAAAILKLIEVGASAGATSMPLALDMPAADILGEAAHWTQPGQPPITVRSLLTMTSNLPNFTRRPLPHLDPWGAVAASKLMEELRQLSPSGWPSSFEYSNTNYFLLSAILDAARLPPERVPRGYRQILRELVFKPAGMTATGFHGESDFRGELAAPIHLRKPAFAEPDWLRGSGDMVSTASDIFAWNAGLLAGRVLAASSVAQMFFESARVTPTDYYGMGWFISQSDGWSLYSHTGSVPGYTSCNVIVRDPGERHWASVTLLTNADNVADFGVLAEDLLRLARQD